MSPSLFTHYSSRLLTAAGLVGAIVYGIVAALGDLRQAMGLFFVLVAGLWFAYAFVAQKLWRLIGRSSPTASEDLSPAHQQKQLAVILFFALLYRLILLPTTPWLSDDFNRYLWDGRLLRHGVNPYQWPPNAPELAGLRDAKIFPAINHPQVGTIYPPLLQILFVTGQFLGGGILSLKFIFLLIDAILLIVLVIALRRDNRDQRQVLLYAWNPLPILEISGSGHADGLMGLLLLLAVLSLGAADFRRAGFILGASFLVKFAGILILPFLWLRGRFRAAAAGFFLIVLAGYLPFLSAGKKIFAGLITFSEKWRFNDGIFSLIFWPIERLLPDSLVIDLMIPPSWEINAETLLSRRIDLALIITKIIVGGLFLVWMARLAWRFRQASLSPESWGRLMILLFAGLLLLAPTFQPWYMLWILPLLAIWPNRALLLLSATVLLSYWILQEHAATCIWRENALIKWLELAPVFALMIYDYFPQINPCATQNGMMTYKIESRIK
jgi:hypothetical protein